MNLWESKSAQDGESVTHADPEQPRPLPDEEPGGMGGELPPLPLDQWEAELGDWESTAGGTCGAIRAGTLGYQRCWLPKSHEGHQHKSQDGERW